MENKSVYLLHNYAGEPLAIYSNLSNLRDGVDYWCKIYSDEKWKDIPKTLLWVEFELDYSLEAMSFDFAYIEPLEWSSVMAQAIKNGIDPIFFRKGEAFAESNAGKNLITID